MQSKPTYIRDGRAPIPEKEVTSRIMSAIGGKNTKPEITLRKALWKKGIRGYRLHWKKVPGKPDIAFPGRKLAIFVNGCYWHRCPICKLKLPKSNQAFWRSKFKKNMKRDKFKSAELAKLDWNIVTIWECEIKSDLEDCLKRVEALL